MKAFLREMLTGFISRLSPDVLYLSVKKFLIRMNLRPIAGICDLKRYQRGRIPDEKVCKYNKVLHITRGYYDYEYFNICFLNNVLSLCLKAICEGYIPRVEILNNKGENIWEMFFKQPFDQISTDGKENVTFDERILEAFPSWNDIYPQSKLKKGFGLLYNKIPVLKDEAKAYAEHETQQLINGKKVLGVLCRGTDYTRSKPKGHPIQPEPSVILEKAVEVFITGKYDAVYLATEDSEYDKLFRNQFGERLLINQRNYYDQTFEKENLTLIKDVHFDRQNDDYLKGLEYISSLLILAKCNGLVSGNCGGTQAAVFWNNGKYEDQVVFDLGLYE